MKPYTSKAKKAIDLAARISKKMNYSYVGTEHILAGLIKEGTGVAAEVLTACNVEYDKLISMIEDLISPGDDIEVLDRDGYSPRTQRVLERASEEADRFECNEIGTEHLLMAIVLQGDCAAARLLNTMGVNSQKLFIDILGAMGEDPSAYRDLMKSYNTSYSSATPVLDQYSRDLTDMAEAGLLDPVIGRKKEMERVIQILCRRGKNNPCLIGEPGVGKTAIVEGLAQDIVSGNVPDILLGKRLVSLDMSGLVAKSKYRGEFEERIKKVISEVSNAKNVLLFIDELHTIIGAGGAEGSLDASNILKPALARGEVQVIGATTIEEYRKYVEKDAALERRFQPVMVEEPSVDETIEILTGLKGLYEKHHGVSIIDDGVKAAVNLSARYINDRFLPDKAIDLMDEAAARIRLKNLTSSDELLALKKEITDKQSGVENALSKGDIADASALMSEKEVLENKRQKLIKKNHRTGAKNQPVVGENEIADVVSGWTKIPVNKLTESEAGRLAKLEQILHKRVIGQEEAVSAVAKAVRRGRVGLKDPKKPIGSFLFLGPTGVGKTEVSKALAEAVFGKEDAMIRVDMSEYMEKHSVSKMIGSPPGYVGFDEGGQLTKRIRQKPYSVVLFDEIEKAHPDVFNILLQILEDGILTDSQGRKVDFKNTIIIMTSNVGAKLITSQRGGLGFSGSQTGASMDDSKIKENVLRELRDTFRPEFLNRVDDIIVFHALTKPDIDKIARKMLESLTKRAKEMDITIEFTDVLVEKIGEAGFDPVYGARPLRRAIQSKIEDKLSEEMLEGNIHAGNSYLCDYEQDKVIFIKK